MARTLIIAALWLSCAVAGCQSLPAGHAATVNIADPGTREAVTSALAAAVKRAHVELGPVDAADTASVTVLPPPAGPLETHAMALPVRFDIVERDGRCVGVRHDTGEAFPLAGVACKPAAN